MPKRILIRKKGQDEYLDRTDQVESIRREERGWLVQFKASAEQYRFPLESVRVIGEPIQAPDEKRFYPFEGNPNDPQGKNILSYLVQFCMAQAIQQNRPQTEDDDSEEETYTPFGMVGDKLAKANAKSNCLGLYLDGGVPAKYVEKDYAYPFGCNASQKRAVTAALTNQLSIIEGPPGTGKTQTILNIIANLLIMGQSVAVASNNNSAVENVAEKLEKEGLGWLIAKLGRRQLREEFFTNGLPGIRVETAWEQKNPDILRKRLIDHNKRVNEIFSKQVRLSEAKQLLDSAQHELDVFCKTHESQLADIDHTKKVFFREENLPHLRQLKAYLADHYGDLKWYHLIRRLRYRQMGVLQPNQLMKARETAVYALDKAILECSIASLEREIGELTDWLKGNKAKVVDQLTSDSMAYFKHCLYKRYAQHKERKFTIDNYKREYAAFRDRFPVLTSSTYSLRNSIADGFTCDYLIIDEASQVNIPTAALCFSMAKNVVIVGDSRQLTHIVDENTIGRGAGIPAAYDAVGQSILTSAKIVFQGKARETMLREHYRCHPLIVDFCNRRFYGGEMIVMSKGGEEFPFEMLLVDDNKVTYSESGSCVNERQVLETTDLIRKMEQEGVAGAEIGVVAPYWEHANMVGWRMRGHYIESDTVHKYQGREKRVIIYNSVVGRPTRFNDDPHLVNVAVSRAKDKFVIVAPEALMQAPDSNMASLMGYIRYHDPECRFVTHATRSSIFDILYSQNDQYSDLLSKAVGKESPAETIFRQTLEAVLTSAQGRLSWGYKQEYHLIDLVRAQRKDRVFTDEEWLYMLHGARLDFLIYDALTQEPVLAVEVDGGHHALQASAHRDQLKDHILSVLQIPLQRFSTRTSSGQEEKALRQLLNEQYLKRNPKI